MISISVISVIIRIHNITIISVYTKARSQVRLGAAIATRQAFINTYIYIVYAYIYIYIYIHTYIERVPST